MGFAHFNTGICAHGSEVNVCGARDGKGNLIGAVPMLKLYITDKGIQVMISAKCSSVIHMTSLLT
jgi:hypothetical protein